MNYKERLNALFQNLNIKAIVTNCIIDGPFIVFDVVLKGSKFRHIERYATEIALQLKAISDPLIYPVTQEGIIKIELMTAPQDTVQWNSVVVSKDFINNILPLALGKIRDGSIIAPDLRKMPHILIGGTTGSGKSVMLHSIINGLLMKQNIKLALIDTKRVEFSFYNSINKLYGNVANDFQDAIGLLYKLMNEMDSRFVKLRESNCRDISTYSKDDMPYIVVVIDELADLMLSDKKTVQELICRLAQKSRACGIHIVAATQRPSVDIVTGLIKANFPARISCHVSSSVDSRVLLGQNGAEKLLGNGDAIIDCPQISFQRFKSAYLNEKQIIQLTNSQKKIWWNNGMV